MAAGGAGGRVPRGAVHPGRAARAALPGGRATWLAAHGYASTVEYLAAHVPARGRRDGTAPPRQRGRAVRGGAGGAAAGDGEPGHDARVDGDGPGGASRLARQGAGPAPGHARGGGANWRSRSPRGSWSGSATRGRTSWRRCGRSPPHTIGTATSKRSSCRTSCPRRAPPCSRLRRARPTTSCGRSRRRRLVLPAEIHVQAPPNLSDDLAPLLDAGIDDWGGVSPVTADHVNPERAWPALDVLRAATEAAGHTLRPG